MDRPDGFKKGFGEKADTYFFAKDVTTCGTTLGVQLRAIVRKL